jgi:hypothetical protein
VTLIAFNVLLSAMCVPAFKWRRLMRQFRTLALVAVVFTAGWITSACTSTTTSRNPDIPMNSACALGFNNDRPCSY